ncbi:MAG: YqaJ viral recombinase family protein [Microbacteriaceae bacterium]
MTFTQPMLSLWDEPARSHTDRVVAHSTDRVAWLRARSMGVSATDVARLSGPNALQALALEKQYGSRFGGNAYTDHGAAREPEIARWVRAEHRIEPSAALFHAHDNKRHLATPDGVAVIDGTLVLAEIKTSSSPWKAVPRAYLRQIWWQQYVLGAERTLLVWEHHVDFVPVDPEPVCTWVERDDDQIHILVGLANQLLALMGRRL